LKDIALLPTTPGNGLPQLPAAEIYLDEFQTREYCLKLDQHHVSLVAAGGLRKALHPRLAVPTYLFRIRLRQGGKPRHQTSDPS
jgi:hypothetical protein